MAKEELFEGIQIMTPQELESSMSSGETNTGDDNSSSDSNENGAIDLEDTSVFAPINKSTDDDDSNIEPTGNTDKGSSNNNEVIYQALIKEMVDNGILSVEEGEDASELPGSLDTIKSLMEKTVDSKTNEKQEKWKNSLSKSKKRFFEIEDAFDDDDMAIQMTERLEFFDSLSTEQLAENPDLQKQIYHQYLLGKGFSEAEAKEEVEDADALAKLEDKASKALPSLRKEANDFVEKSRTAKTEAIENKKVKAQEAFDNLIKNIESKESFIDGINLNKVAREKLKENITKPVHTDESGKQYTSLMYKQKQNAAEFEMLINYYDSIGLFNMDKKSGSFKPDISKLKAEAKTRAINEIDKVIAKDNARGVGRNTSVETSKNTSDILNALDGAFGKK